MKKLYFLLVIAALFFTSTTASAQFLNQGGRGSSSAEVSNVMNFADITYSPVNFKAKGDGSSIDIFDLNAISLNWGQARNIMNILPLYVHYGFNLQYAWKTDKDEDGGWTIKETCSFLTAKIPVNLLYNLNIPNTAVSVMPYVGLNLQGHILGQEKYKLTYDDESETFKYSFFNKEDMEEIGEEFDWEFGTFNRFIVGWQVGAKVAFNNYYIGIAYEGPISSLYKEYGIKIKTSQINISLGIRF